MTRHLSPAKAAALLVIPVSAGIYFYFFKDLTAVIGGDAPSYINLDPSRPVAYGAFLNAAFKIGLGLNAIPVIQAALLLGCLWIVACIWTACTGWFALALAWQGLTIANVLLVQSSVYLVPDAVSAALMMLAFAAWIGIATGYSRKRLVLLLLICGFASLFRPTNLILLVASAGMLLVVPGLLARERLIALGAAAMMSILALAASPAFYFYRYGSAATSSPAARGLLQKTLFKAWAPDQAAAECGGEVIEAATHDVVDYLRTTPPVVRSILEDKYSNYLRFSVIIPELQSRFHLKSEGEINTLIACYVTARMKQDPLHFAARFAHDYLRLGLYLVFADPRERAQYEAFVAANPPPQPAASARLGDQIGEGFERAGMALPSDVRQDDAASLFEPPLARAALPLLVLRIFQALALAISAVLAIKFVFEMLRLTRAASDAIIVWPALVLQLNTIATAAFEVPLPRYMTPLWPLSVAVVVLAASMAAPRVRAALRWPELSGPRTALLAHPK